MITLIAFTFFSFICGWIGGRLHEAKIHADRTRAERALERQQRTVTPFDERHPGQTFHNNHSWLQKRRGELRAVK